MRNGHDDTAPKLSGAALQTDKWRAPIKRRGDGRVTSLSLTEMPPGLQDDIQHINEQFFLLANEYGESVLRSMDASIQVVRRIVEAGAGSIGTAIRCGVPLTIFNDTVEELALSDPQKWRSSSAEVPEQLKELTRFVLEFAHDLVHVNRTIAQIYFGFSRLSCDAYGRLSHKHLITLSQRHGVLLRLLGGQRPQDWERLFIGERVSGPIALQISQQTGLMMLAAE